MVMLLMREIDCSGVLRRGCRKLRRRVYISKVWLSNPTIQKASTPTYVHLCTHLQLGTKLHMAHGPI